MSVLNRAPARPRHATQRPSYPREIGWRSLAVAAAIGVGLTACDPPWLGNTGGDIAVPWQGGAGGVGGNGGAGGAAGEGGTAGAAARVRDERVELGFEGRAAAAAGLAVLELFVVLEEEALERLGVGTGRPGGAPLGGEIFADECSALGHRFCERLTEVRLRRATTAACPGARGAQRDRETQRG